MKFLNLGIKIANKSSHKYRHSSILIKGGKVFSYGHNHDNIHAEVNCLNNVWSSIRKNSTIINFRVDKIGLLRNSYPCPNCLTYCKTNKVKKIIYSTEEGFKEIKL